MSNTHKVKKPDKVYVYLCPVCMLNQLMSLELIGKRTTTKNSSLYTAS